jgi:hypothetical protein
MTRNTTKAERRTPPAGRTGRPVRPASRLRRVELACGHGWVRDPVAGLHDWIWCEECADWSRVHSVED